MKQFSSWFCLVLVFGMLVGRPLVALAAEHGGQEHGGEGTATETNEAAVLNEAASALEGTDAALAAELKAWAEGTGTGDKNATLEKAAAALEAGNPDLAEKLTAMTDKKEHGGEATA